MQIHRIHAGSLAEALERARAEHGERAVVLSQETQPDGAVTLAVSVATRARAAAAPAVPREDPGLRDVRVRLEKSGASRALARHVVQAVERSGARGAYALDAAARVLGRAFPVQPSPKRDGRARVIALCGPSGAGKTTTMAKLGRRLAEAGRRVVYATLDGLGVSEVEALAHAAADGDRHEIEVHAIASTAEIDLAAASALAVDVVLLDTPGVALRDAQGLADLQRELARLGGDCEAHLVLPATLSGPALAAALEAYGALAPAAVVATKLDETPCPAALLERCRAARIPTSFLCDGPDARGGLRRARPDHFADLCLRGRMSA